MLATQAAAANFKVSSLAETERLAARLGPLLRSGDVVALSGDLGSGKTAFARGLIWALLGPETDVPSPTFNLVLTYDLDNTVLWHFDLYRLERPDDAFELGIEDAFATGISLIEWPEKLGGLLPADSLRVSLTADNGPDTRLIEMTGSGEWPARLKPMTDDA